MSELTRRLTTILQRSATPLIYDNDDWHTTDDLTLDVQAIGGWLERAGIRPGDRVVLGYPNSYAFAAVFLALLQSGVVVAPINPAMTASELGSFLARSGAVCGFFSEGQRVLLQELQGHRTTAMAAELALQTAFFADPLSSPLPTSSLRLTAAGWTEVNLSNVDVLAAGSPQRWPEPADEDGGVLLYTSGTTGRPKAVLLRHQHLLATANNVIRSHQLTAADVTYCFLPLFHINAQVVALLSTWLSGGRVVVGSKFSASQFWPTVAAHRVTWVSAVPTVIAMLLNKPGPDKAPSHLRFVRSASAQLPALHARSFERRFQVPVIQSYGMTEAASQICVNPLEPGARKLGSVGLPCGVELQIVAEDDVPVALGTVGEVVIRGENVIEQYEDAGLTADFRKGWFHTGDVGYLDADGFVYLTGRQKEMINRAGEKISPYEVEDVIREHPAVAAVAVIGLPDALYGERIGAYIVLGDGPYDGMRLLQEITEHCQRLLSRFKCPSEIEIVSELPVGSTGKIQRHVLKELISARHIS